MKKDKNKDKNILNVISTFNGIGSASDGLKQTGITFIMDTVCEIDTAANNTYYANFTKTKHVDDINSLLVNIKEGRNFDLLIQSPPCQSFSNQGLRAGLSCTNGNLFLKAIELQKKINANIAVYENVTGLLSHNKNISKHKSLINKIYSNTIGHTMHTIEKLLIKDTRYNFYWKIINSIDMGLPQSRKRVFIVGIKKELDLGFTFPHNTELKFTVADILDDNTDTSYCFTDAGGNILRKRHKVDHKIKYVSKVKIPNKPHLAAEVITISYQKDKKIYHPYIATCITTGNNTKFLIDKQVRKLTTNENLKIHGFSDDFKLIGSKTAQNKQLGNTVSPKVYKTLFEMIFKLTKLITIKGI